MAHNAPLPSSLPQAVRVGYDTDHFYGNLTQTIKANLNPNGQLQITFPMEGAGVVAAITEMLLQSHELPTGLLRFFPGIKVTEPAEFKTLRANGAFLVSAAFDPTATATAAGTQVHGVTIQSEAGMVCSFVNPFAPPASASAPPTGDGGRTASGGAAAAPSVTNVATGANVPLQALGTPNHFSFATTAGATYAINP